MPAAIGTHGDIIIINLLLPTTKHGPIFMLATRPGPELT